MLLIQSPCKVTGPQSAIENMGWRLELEGLLLVGLWLVGATGVGGMVRVGDAVGKGGSSIGNRK